MYEEFAPAPADPSDDALLALLAIVASSDGAVHEREIDLLARLFPERARADLRAECERRAGASGIDLLGIADQFRSIDRRLTGLRFAARMAWRDGQLEAAERALLVEIASAMELSPTAVDRVLREMQPGLEERFAADRILRLVQDLQWSAVQLAGGQMVSADLGALVQPDAEIVARVGLDKIEVVGLCTTGIVARFQDGAAFLAWSDLVSYGRDGALGAGIRLLTEDGRDYELVDARLAGLAPLLDRLFDDRERKKATAPVFQRVRGD